MSDKEIEALAREYVDELFRDDDLTDIQTQDEKNDCYVQCMTFLGFVKDRYEIVPKEIVREEYDYAKRTRDLYMSASCINTMESRAIDHSIGRMYELAKLFPQTLKPEEE